MIIGYTKLFGKILKSSIWNEDDKTRLVWITMLALAGPDGVVIGNPGSLARDANVPEDATRRALEKFLAPDADSGTPDDDGKRIERVDGGWRLLNHAKYKAMMSQEHRAAYKAAKARQYRLEAKQARRGLTAREAAREKLVAQDAVDGVESK